MDSLLVYNIGELVTCQPLAKEQRGHSVSAADLGRLNAAWLLIQGEEVVQVGTGPLPDLSQLGSPLRRQDAKGRLVMPGLIDAHTHPLFAGARYQEFAMRLNGQSYQEIAAKGGGIKASVNASRLASNACLEALAHSHLDRFLRHGVTTVEVKSGYGLSLGEELRHLGILNQLKACRRQKLLITCLALHALPPEESSYAAYIDRLSQELLPQLAENKLASYVDAFIESGYFSVADCQNYMQTAKDLGLGLRLHADEFSNAGGAQAAADWGAASADHLQFASPLGIAALAREGVVATILPGTSLYTAIPFTQARKFADAGCSVAIASDFNPGSCLIANLPMLATIAGLHCGLKVAEIIAGITFVPALSLGLSRQKGALAPGYDADFCIYAESCVEEWLAQMGQSLPQEVWLGGQKEVFALDTDTNN